MALGKTNIFALPKILLQNKNASLRLGEIFAKHVSGGGFVSGTD